MTNETPSASTGPLAVVTGAAGDIGRSIALRLAENGWRLALVDCDEPALDEIVARVRGASDARDVAGFACDVSDEASVATLGSSVRTRLGAARALVNNAGIGGTGTPIEAMDLSEWSAMLAADLTSLFLTCREFAPDLKADGRGRVVNLGSISAHIGVAGSTAYTAAKGGVVAFSKSLAREWAASHVTVNVVAPGVIDTKMARRRGIDHQRHLIPWHRLGRPDDVAGAIAYLLSPEAEFMTGQVLHLNGGASM